MKYTIVFILLLYTFSNNLSAQQIFQGGDLAVDNAYHTSGGMYVWRGELFKGDTIDKALITVFYDCKFMTDTTTKQYVEYIADLEIGINYSKFYGHKLYVIDSLCSNQEFIDSKKARQTIHKYYRNEYSWTFNDALYTRYADKSNMMSSRFIEIDYIYESNAPKFDWTIVDSTKIILGYNVQKAVCTHNGRDYEAWFSTEIPISSGPWKFYGLPGLIFSIKDTKEEYVYNIRGVSRQKRQRLFPQYDYIRISEEQYNELRVQAIEVPSFIETHSPSSMLYVQHLKPIRMMYRLQ